MTRGLWPVLLLLTACSGKTPPHPPPADLGHGEGLAFPDRLDRSEPPLDRLVDLPVPSDQHSERTSVDQDTGRLDALADRTPVDTWPGGPCFFEWSKWSCTPIISVYCSAACGGGLAQIVCLSSCTCKKGGLTHSCGPASSTGCGRCKGAFLAGCCNF